MLKLVRCFIKRTDIKIKKGNAALWYKFLYAEWSKNVYARANVQIS